MLLLLLALSQVGSALRVSPSKEKLAAFAQKATFGMPSFYHTTGGMSTELKRLADGNCQNKLMTVEDKQENVFSPTIQVVTIKPKEGQANHRAMYIAGEHARELIGSEAAFQFVKDLCSGGSNQLVQQSSRNTEFKIIVNANPTSRMLVENGAHCLRASTRGVDLNRNWDVNYNDAERHPGQQTDPGFFAFSEPETRMMKKTMEDFKPHSFIDVHSGTLGMFLPNKLSKEPEKSRVLQKALVGLDEKYCNCPMGIADKEVGYHTSGSSLDYAAEKTDTNFALAVEIWTDKENLAELRSRFGTIKKELYTSLLQGASLVDDSMKLLAEKAAEIEAKIEKEGADACFGAFNPTEEAAFLGTVSHWSNAFADFSIAGEKLMKK